MNFQAIARIDTPQELLYYQHGGILQYVLRQLLATKETAAKQPAVREAAPAGSQKLVGG